LNKIEFLEILSEYLQKIDKKERDKFITYYDEMIEDYKENGYEELDAVKKIGNPRDIAMNILEEQNVDIVNLPSSQSKFLKTVLLIIGFPLWGCVLLTVALLILSAIIVIWCVPVTTGAGAFGFFITSIVGIIGSPFLMMENLSLGVIQLGLGVASIGIAYLLAIVTVTMSKKMISITQVLTCKLSNIYKKKAVKI
jgi:uncharacterized membrane protein